MSLAVVLHFFCLRREVSASATLNPKPWFNGLGFRVYGVRAQFTTQSLGPPTLKRNLSNPECFAVVGLGVCGVGFRVLVHIAIK